MKKKQLKIADLKIQSFVTSVEEEKSETVKGGSFVCQETRGPGPVICPNTIFPDRSFCDPSCLTIGAPEICF